MTAADKRASLLSDLLAAKGGATGGDTEKPPEPEHASVISIAKRRMSEERPSEAPAAAPSVLYSKGAATASTFRPSYWSFDHDEQAAPNPAPPKAESALAPGPTQTSIPPVAHGPKSRPVPINFVFAFGCVALFVSTALLVLSQWHRGDAPTQPQVPVTIAAAPAPMPVPARSVVPPTPALPAETAAAVAPTVPTPAVTAPAPLSTAVAPAPTPAVSTPAPVAREPPPPAPADPAVKVLVETPAVVASAPVPAAPVVDTQQADALLARGDNLLATGDVAAARLFYQRAAELGSAAAATAVGQTYDPGVLELLRVRGARGDAQIAAEWYRKAMAAGDRKAEIRLKRLLARGAG